MLMISAVSVVILPSDKNFRSINVIDWCKRKLVPLAQDLPYDFAPFPSPIFRPTTQFWTVLVASCFVLLGVTLMSRRVPEMVRVAVIGAGSSGITAAKTCLEYGYEVVCYEKTRDIGGLWRYKPHECDGEASVMKSTIINTSKEMSAFSDFPPPAEFANFMHNRQMLSYFRMYAEKFGVLPHIKYQHAVQLVKRADDYESTGRWAVTANDMVSGNVHIETFDGVMLCTGHHAEPNVATFPGLQDGTFKGEVSHSHSYKDHVGFNDKTVVVVGIGNSGADITVELSRCAKQVYLVTRRGSWIWHRVFDEGLPVDMFLNSHYYNFLAKTAPKLMQALTERKLLKRCDLENFGLLPAHHLMQQHPTVSDELPNRIASGSVIVKPNIESFIGPKRCLFEDGTIVDGIDAVVLCTGYKFGFPYLEPGVIPVSNNKVELYKYMYDPTLSHPETLAAIGFIQPIGAIFPLFELQSRVFCEHLQRKRQLPSVEKMYEDISLKAKRMKELYVDSDRHTIQVAFIPYITELARLIDAQPASPLAYLLKGDPKLAYALAFGPCVSYEFRLRGPHAWPGARDAILSVWDRVIGATKTRKTPPHICGKGRRHGLDCYVKEHKFAIAAVFAFIGVVLLVLTGYGSL